MNLVVTRSLVAEMMDDPAVDAGRHRQALRGLARLNRLSRPDRAMWAAIAEALPGAARLRVVDIACGGGDVSVALQRRAARSGVALDIVGIDASTTAIAVARERAARLASPVTFEHGDPLANGLGGAFDVATCSLFLHHLDRDRARRLLRIMATAARHLVLVDDLARSAAGLFLAASVPYLVSRSAIVHVDARRSVRASFTPAEAAAVAVDAGLQSVRVQRHWPLRYLLRGLPGDSGAGKP